MALPKDLNGRLSFWKQDSNSLGEGKATDQIFSAYFLLDQGLIILQALELQLIYL